MPMHIPTGPENKIRLIIGVLIVLVVVAIIILGGVPPVSRDALTHHLAVPKIYIESGGLVEIPDYPFSYYPMNLHLLYLLPLYWGNDILAKYIHFAFALFTALLIFLYLKKRSGVTGGLVGVLLFVSLPVIIKLSITVYVDLGLVFFSTAALLAFIQWLENGFQRRYLVGAAIACGLALGTKYNGLITFFLLTLFVPFAFSVKNRHDHRRNTKAIACGVLFATIALLFFSPWMIRNVVWKGNPLYPLYDSVFQKQNQAAEPAVVAKPTRPSPPALDHFTFRRYAYGDSPLEIAAIPIRIFYQGRDNDPKYFDGVLNPYLLILPLIWLAMSGRKAWDLQAGEFYLAAFAGLYFLFVFFRIDMRIRWIAPIIPPLVILSVMGLHKMVKALSTVSGRGPALGAGLGLALLMVVALSLNFRYLVQQFNAVMPLEYISGRISRADYISRHRPAYPVHVYANRHLPRDAVILGLFLGNRRYYSDRRIVFNHYLLKDALSDNQPGRFSSFHLRQQGITHILLRQDLFEKWVHDNLSAPELEALARFFNNEITLLTSNSGYYLYELNYGNGGGTRRPTAKG